MAAVQVPGTATAWPDRGVSPAPCRKPRLSPRFSATRGSDRKRFIGRGFGTLHVSLAGARDDWLTGRPSGSDRRAFAQEVDVGDARDRAAMRAEYCHRVASIIDSGSPSAGDPGVGIGDNLHRATFLKPEFRPGILRFGSTRSDDPLLAERPHPQEEPTSRRGIRMRSQPARTLRPVEPTRVIGWSAVSSLRGPIRGAWCRRRSRRATRRMDP